MQWPIRFIRLLSLSPYVHTYTTHNTNERMQGGLPLRCWLPLRARAGRRDAGDRVGVAPHAVSLPNSSLNLAVACVYDLSEQPPWYLVYPPSPSFFTPFSAFPPALDRHTGCFHMPFCSHFSPSLPAIDRPTYNQDGGHIQTSLAFTCLSSLTPSPFPALLFTDTQQDERHRDPGGDAGRGPPGRLPPRPTDTWDAGTGTTGVIG